MRARPTSSEPPKASRSGVAACVELDTLPRSAVLAGLAPAMQRCCLLHGGDDYELLFTAPPGQHAAVLAAAQAAAVGVTHIGHIEAGNTLRVLDGAGRPLA